MENKEKIIRKIANRVSKKYGLYPPINFTNVFQENKIKYGEEKLGTDGDGYSNLKDSELKIIVNSQTDYVPRKRFTIAHELGHIFIGWHDDITLCKTNNEYTEHNMLDIQEKEANVFASELLMPTDWVKVQLEKYKNYGLDYIIKNMCDNAQTSVMACLYALENAMQSGNVLLVFSPTLYWGKKFISNNTKICYLQNRDFQERCEILCIDKQRYEIASYEILHYQFLARPDKKIIEEIYNNTGSLLETIQLLSRSPITKVLPNFSHIINCITDRYVVWLFEGEELLYFDKNCLLEMQIPNRGKIDDIVQLCDHYKYFYECKKMEMNITAIAVKEPIYKDIQAWKVNKMDSKLLCNQILNDIYIGKELEEKRRMISGIIGSANSMHKDFSVEELYNLMQKRMRRFEIDDFVNHQDFNKFVSLKSYELVNKRISF